MVSKNGSSSNKKNEKTSENKLKQKIYTGNL